jgi:hypothetical protein
MTFDSLKLKLCEFGNLQIAKEGLVLSVLITGSGLSRGNTVMNIQKILIDYAKEKYPTIEAFRNDDNFFCLILKPKTEV